MVEGVFGDYHGTLTTVSYLDESKVYKLPEYSGSFDINSVCPDVGEGK
jgi:hypothetical protein